MFLKKKNLLYLWRFGFFITLISLFLANIIPQFTLLSVIGGIVLLNGLPWLYEKIRNRVFFLE